MPHVIQQLQRKEDDYRLAHPSWFDQSEVPEKLQKSWREACESRETNFKFGTYGDSAVWMLSSTLRADWFQPPVQDFLDKLPIVKAGVIAGVYKTKGATPWAAEFDVPAESSAHGGMVCYCPWLASCVA